MTATELNELIFNKLGRHAYIEGTMNALRFLHHGYIYRVTTDLNVEKVDGTIDSDTRQLEKLLRGEQWDGTGLPPVGMKLEWKSEKYGWLGGTVAAHDAKYSGIAIIRHNDGYTGCHSFELRTAEMRIRSEAISQINNIAGVFANQSVSEQLYDAIVAGKIDGLGKVG